MQETKPKIYVNLDRMSEEGSIERLMTAAQMYKSHHSQVKSMQFGTKVKNGDLADCLESARSEMRLSHLKQTQSSALKVKGSHNYNKLNMKNQNKK